MRNNGHFTFTNDLALKSDGSYKYLDVKVRVVPAWCKPEHLGIQDMSETITCSDVGATKTNPDIAMKVLWVWMLQKFQHKAFHTRRSCRRHLFAKEHDELKNNLRSASPAAHNDKECEN